VSLVNGRRKAMHPLTHAPPTPIIDRRPRRLHGHSHASVHIEIGETTVLCNPFGYAVEELNPEFMDRLVVDL